MDSISEVEEVELPESTMHELGLEPAITLNNGRRPYWVAAFVAFVLVVVGLHACKRSLELAFVGETVVSSSPDRYADLIDSEPWASAMPRAVPTSASDVRFSFQTNNGLHHYFHTELSVVLMPSQVERLLAHAEQNGTSFPPAENPWNLSSSLLLSEGSVNANDFNDIRQFTFSLDGSSRFQGVSINPTTNRVVWVSHSDGG
jgi:hypothetical protein